MPTQTYSTGDGSYLRALNNVPIDDAAAVAVPFLGAVGVNLVVDSGYTGATVDVSGGECSLVTTGQGTRTVFALSDGVGLAMVVAT